jgi:hypothetical protein
MSDNLVVAWNKAALEAVRRTRMGPPIVARALHVLHAAMYDASAALLDAGIACWDTKRTYDSARPITAIRYLFAGQEVLAWGGPGQGTRRIRGEDWQPYIATPPFPEYVSGHSTFSSAAAVVLARFTGSDRFGAGVTVAAGSSRVEPGVTPAADVTLSWPTFTDAAVQARRSRRYGGIHFREGNLTGQAIGREVGARAWEAASALFAGRAAGPPP